jgi:hypothetical protein
MKIKWLGMSLLLLSLLAFAAMATAEEKVIVEEIKLDDSGEKKIIVKVIGDESEIEDLEWTTEDGEVIVIKIDEDGEHVIHGDMDELDGETIKIIEKIHCDDESGTWTHKKHGKKGMYWVQAGKEKHKGAAKAYKMAFDAQAGGPFLGVTLSDIDEDEAKDAGLRKKTGVRVLQVSEDSAAEEAGIEAGDIITRFEGKKIDDASELVDAVSKREVGDEVDLQVMRDGKKKKFSCVLGERENNFAFFGSDDEDHKWQALKDLDIHIDHGENDIFVNRILGSFPHGPRLGVEIRDLGEDMAAYFPGAEIGQVLVMGITDDSVAEEVGIKSGDIIMEFGGEKIADSNELREAVQSAEAGEDIALNILRQGKTMKLTVNFKESDMGVAHMMPQGIRKMQRFHEFDNQELEERLKELEVKLEELSKILN